jgi:hypothetical protein
MTTDRWPFDDYIELWLWEYTDEHGKRRRSTWRMTEGDAAHYRDAVKVEETLELRRPLGIGRGHFKPF